MPDPTTALPDPAVLNGVGAALAAAAPSDWTTVEYVMFWLDVDVYEDRMWVAGTQTARHRVMPPLVGLALEELREADLEEGREAWQRCDVRLTRQPGSQQPTFQVDFAYEVGQVPE